MCLVMNTQRLHIFIQCSMIVISSTLPKNFLSIDFPEFSYKTQILQLQPFLLVNCGIVISFGSEYKYCMQPFVSFLLYYHLL